MSQRMEKLQKLARQVIGDEVMRLKDPRVGFVTVTSVRISNDLSHAKVYVTVMGSDEERDRSLEGLRSASPHLRTVLGRAMHTRLVPELKFLIDDVTETAGRIEELIKRIHDEDGRT